MSDPWEKEREQLEQDLAEAADRVMKSLEEHGGSIVQHLLDSDENDDWPFWIVMGADNINRIKVVGSNGCVFFTREDAEAISDKLNGEAS